MTSTKKIKFKKVTNLPALSDSQEGDLFFCKEDETIYIRGTNSYEKFRGKVDTTLSPSSTNPVANKVITNALGNRIEYSDYILNTNPFIQRSRLYISKIDNAWYALDKRHTVTASLYEASGTKVQDVNAASLFDGIYEDGYSIKEGRTLKVHIKFDGQESSKLSDGTKVYPGYPYGLIILSFYYINEPESVTGRVYCNYESQGIGWHTLTFSPGPKEANDSNKPKITYNAKQSYFNISELEIEVKGKALVDRQTQLTEVEMALSRPDPIRTPFISKYAKEKLYYDLEAPSFTASKFNGPSTSIVDYNNTNRNLQIGYSGAGLTTSEIKQVACYTEGNKIKDASLNNFKQWLDIQNLSSKYGKFTEHARYGHYYSNCIEYNHRDGETKNEILIKTTIPFKSDNSMLLISIDGYDYYYATAISKKLYFYINNSVFTRYGYTNTDSQKLQIYLSTYTRDSKKYVAISLKYSTIYRTRFKVSCLDIWTDTFRDSYFENWTIEDNNFVSGGTSIIPQDDIVEVPRNKIATDITGDSDTVNGHTVDINVPSNAKFTDTTYESKTAVKDGTDVSLVTTGEKAIWNGAIRTISNGSYISTSTTNNNSTISAVTKSIEEANERTNGLATALDVKTYVADKTRVDSTLSDTSTNPVQNKVIKVSLDNLNDNIENVASTANTANNTATAANSNAISALNKVTALENKETTIAGQKVKVGGEVTPVQLTKGLQFPTRNVLNLIMSDATACSSSFNTYLAENNITISDYFCAPTMIYSDESDLMPYCGMLYNSPDSGCLTGIFDISTDEANFDDICKIQFTPSNCTFNIGDSGLTQAPSITINVTTRPTTSSPVTVNLTEYQYKQMIDMGVKKYVSFQQVATVNNIGNIVELNFTNKVISIVDNSENYVYQHICYYSGGIHVFEFNLNSGTKVLTAKMIM